MVARARRTARTRDAAAGRGAAREAAGGAAEVFGLDGEDEATPRESHRRGAQPMPPADPPAHRSTKPAPVHGTSRKGMIRGGFGGGAASAIGHDTRLERRPDRKGGRARRGPP